MNFRMNRKMFFQFLAMILSAAAVNAAQNILWEYDFTAAQPAANIAQGTFQQGKGLLCDKGYYNLSVPLLVKTPIQVEITASRGEKPVNFTMLLVHVNARGETGTFKNIVNSQPLTRNEFTYRYLVNDPAFSGQGKKCSLFFYRVKAANGGFGAQEPVLLKRLRIVEAAADMQAPYLNLPCEWNGAQPVVSALKISGSRQMDNGVPAAVTDKDYVTGVLKLNCKAGRAVTVTVDARTAGTPGSTLGMILFDSEKGLKMVGRIGGWQVPVKEVYTPVSFTCPASLFKKDGQYTVFVYRSNQKGTLYIRSIKISENPQK